MLAVHARLDGMRIFHIKYESIFIPVNSIFTQISIPRFYFIDACVQFEAYSFSSYVLNTQTRANWKTLFSCSNVKWTANIIWEKCILSTVAKFHVQKFSSRLACTIRGWWMVLWKTRVSAIFILSWIGLLSEAFCMCCHLF